MQKNVTLAIEKLAGLGDGLAVVGGKRVFVPYTLPGDVIEASITQVTRDADYAMLEKIITPGKDRITPVCRHFGVCGGCTLQHINDGLYAAFKQAMAEEAVRKAGFDPALTRPLVRLPAAARRRVELKMEEYGRLGYYKRLSHWLVDITECKVLEPELEALVLRLKARLAEFSGSASLHINAVDQGYDLLLTTEENLPAGWLADPSVARVTQKKSDGLRLLYGAPDVTVTIGGIAVKAPPGAFLQAQREAQRIMTDCVLEAMKGSKAVLDLFAGLGTYSIPLAAQGDVTSMEGDGPMVAELAGAAARNGLRIKAKQRDLFKNPVTAKEFSGFDGLVMNPPRVGAKEQVAELAASTISKLVLVSCNPATFARDVRLLREGGYKLKKALPIDQFVYSSHLEIVAEFYR